MHIVHLSAECYPAAKVGGLGDVVGSLPKYLNAYGKFCEVIIPKYKTPWLEAQEYDFVCESSAYMGNTYFEFKILKEKTNVLGFNLYVIDIVGRFDRPGVYIDPYSGHSYWDEYERALSYQIAALEWIRNFHNPPDVIHCHDHHTSLVPFMMTQCEQFKALQNVPTVITVHNAEYQGRNNMSQADVIPPFIPQNYGLLEWNGELNSLAAALKCAWQITTVSSSYMKELSSSSNGLELLFQHESNKSRGIINGIDNEVWNPATDPLIEVNYTSNDVKSGKKKNKEILCKQFNLNPELPTIAFIGRLVAEKGADLLPDLIKHFKDVQPTVNFILLGTGDPALHDIFSKMGDIYFGYFDASLEYNEQLAHQMYAGSDFIIMPSRVEPCGLNQMFAMRYGTIAIVRSVGGLIDTVKDINEGDGYGIRFNKFDFNEAVLAIDRAIQLYNQKKEFQKVVSRIVKLDYSWNNSAKEYITMYQELLNK